MKEMSKRNESEESAGGVSLARMILNLLSGKGKGGFMKAVGIIALAAALLGTGFFTGRKTMVPETDTQTVYIPGDTIEISVPVPVPVQVVKPVDTANVILDCIRSGKYAEMFPEIKKDSIVYVSKEDTSAVLADWATERIYEEKVFDIDTVGTATVRAKTQYNRLTWLGASFVPVTKETTVTNVVSKKYSPFIGFGITTMPEAVLNGGLYFDDKYGMSIMYEYNWQIRKHAVGFMGTLKF
jgi:hypothetical protein